MLICLINSKIYIGKTNNLKNRIGQHKRSKDNVLINYAFNKYGWDNFTLFILQDYDDIPDNLELLALETAYIEYFDSLNRKIGYNRCLCSTDVTGTKLTEEHKKKLSLAKIGKPRSEETKRKISENNVQFFLGKTRPDISLLFGKPVKQIDKKTNKIIKIWPSLSEVERQLGFANSNLSKVCNGKLKSLGGFKWSYV